MADNLLDKASILLTPTAYDNGRMLSVKPNENLYGSEEVTNGDFSNGLTDWSAYGVTSVSSGVVTMGASANSGIFQGVLTQGKKYKATINVVSYNGVGIAQVTDDNGFALHTITTTGLQTFYFEHSISNSNIIIRAIQNGVLSISSFSIVEDLSGDFQFERNSAATRVNAQGLVENVQIISSELVSNGNFSQIGTEEVLNGNFSQEGSELVTNGDFATDSDWNKGTGWSISVGSANCNGSQTSNSLFFQNIGSLANKTVKFSFTLSNYVSGQINTAFFSASGTTSYVASANGDYTFYIDVASGHNGNTGFTANSDFIGSIDNVSVKEVGQNWILGTGWSIGDGKAERLVATSSTDLVQLNMLWNFTSNYKISFDVKATAGSVRARIGQTNLNYVGQGTHTFYAIPSGNDQLKFQADSSFTGSIDNISVKEVGQDWTLGSSNVSIQEGKAVYINQSAGDNGIYQNVLSQNKKYKVSFDVSNYQSGDITAWAGGSQNSLSNDVVSGNGLKTIKIENSGSTNGFLVFGNNSTGNYSLDNISLKEITDDTNIPRINYEGFSYQDTLGSEEVVNGDFATDSDWTKETGWTISGGTANFSGGTANKAIYQAVGITNGKTYKIQYQVSSISAGQVAVRFGGMVGVDEITATTIGTYTGYITATGSANGNIHIEDNNNSFIGSIDNVSVKEYLGQEIVPDSGCGSWLLEKQSTNLATYSEDFSNSYWTKTGASLSSSFASPSGDLSAFKLVEDTSTGVHGLTAVVSGLTIGNTHTISIYAKAGENNYMYMRFRYAGNTNVMFDLVNGTIGVSGSNVLSKSIEPMTNGYYKCTITASAPTSTEGFRIYSSSNGTDISYTGDGTSGLYIWGAQVEAQSYATSYIPTNGATNTRLQDIATNSGNSTLINSTEGVLYAEIAANNLPTFKHISLSDDSGANRLNLFIYNSDITVNFEVSGVRQSSLSYAIPNVSDFNKVAFSYKLNQFKLFVNGLQKSIDTLGLVPSINTFNSLSFNNSTSSNFFGKAKALAVYKEALTDANLRSLTYPNPVATTFDLDFDTISEQFTFTRGSEATFVNAQGLIESTASNDAPRIDYSTGAKAFLLEGQSTNLIPYSEDFSQSDWVKLGAGAGSAAVVTSNYAISPDGTQNASRLQCDLNGGGASSGNQSLIYDLYSSSGNQTMSVYLKSNTNSNQTIYFANTQTSGDTITITSEWQRFEFSHNTSTYVFAVGLRGRSGGAINDTADILIYGAQAEQQSYATSYIPTSGASATRNQELCYDATPVINSEEGTLYAEISALANDGGNRIISVSSGDQTNRVIIFYTSVNNQIRVISATNSANQFDRYFTLSDVKSLHKVAIKYKENDFSFWVDGSKISSGSSGLAPIGLSELSFDNGSGGARFFGNTKGLKYYPKALADVQLEDLTTI